MRNQRGFTLVELLIVSVLTAVTLAGIYQTLMVQEKSYEAAGLMINDQESLRTALGILESELREIGAIGGSAIGGSDIAVAADDSIVFRAQRKTAFMCTVSRADKWAQVWFLGDAFAAGDEILLFVDGDSLSYDDDRWDTTVVSGVSDQSVAACDSVWSGVPQQLLRLENQDLSGVRRGAPIRAFERVTYSIYRFGPLGYGLGRNQADESPTYLVGGLAEPGKGLRFEYFTADGASTNDPTKVARMRITVRTDPGGNTRVEETSMTSNLFLRNN